MFIQVKYNFLCTKSVNSVNKKGKISIFSKDNVWIVDRCYTFICMVKIFLYEFIQLILCIVIRENIL